MNTVEEQIQKRKKPVLAATSLKSAAQQNPAQKRGKKIGNRGILILAEGVCIVGG